MANEDHVDIDSLNDLKDIMESEYEMLINTYLSDSEARIVDIQAAIDSADADALRKSAHSIKGSSSNVCATALAEIARLLENAGKEGTTNGMQAKLDELKAEFAVVTEILRGTL
ncbi:Probably signal protein, hpt [gamma proteobacterium HdN1]|nr:Probably signal protein, hpt [gamma proteobacterium HdN1]